MEYQKCYMYTDEGKSKRQKLTPKGLEPSLRLRKDAFRDYWSRQQSAIDDVIQGAIKDSVRRITYFVKEAPSDRSFERIPSGLVVTDGSSISSKIIFDQVEAELRRETHLAVVRLHAPECPNLKSFLKSLIQRATRSIEFDEQTSAVQLRSKSSSRLLLYDLQLLSDWCKSRNVGKVVVILEDSEAFDTTLLADAIPLLKSWSNRIPFLLFFGIGTSVMLFEERLPRAAILCLTGQQFHLPNAEMLIDGVFGCSVSADYGIPLQIGPSLCEMLVLRQLYHLQSIETFTEAIKFAYMCHFFGNALSLFLFKGSDFDPPSKEHYEAVRRLNSFKSHCEYLVEQRRNDHVQSLLLSDEALDIEISNGIIESRDTIHWALGAMSVYRILESSVASEYHTSLPVLYQQIISGEFTENRPSKSWEGIQKASLQEVFKGIRRANPETLMGLLCSVEDKLMTMPPSEYISVSPDDFRDIRDELEQITGITPVANGSDDIEMSTERMQLNGQPPTKHLKTPRKSQRATKATPKASTRHSNTQSKSEAKQLKLANKFCEHLTSYFKQATRNFKTLFLHEILFYDIKGTHRDLFTKNPRLAVENALSNPHYYLGCECCAVTGDNPTPELASTHPPTSILYRLYLDSGALINVADLWQAFQQAIAPQYGEDEKLTMALFYRGMAELKMMGYIKSSKKKLDCVEKLAWKGL